MFSSLCVCGSLSHLSRHLVHSPGLELQPCCQIHWAKKAARQPSGEPEAQAPTAAGTRDPVRNRPLRAPQDRWAHGLGVQGLRGGRARSAVSLRMRPRRCAATGRGLGWPRSPDAHTPFIWPLRQVSQPDLSAKLSAKLRRMGRLKERPPASVPNFKPHPRPRSHARPQMALPDYGRRSRTGARLVLTLM